MTPISIPPRSVPHRGEHASNAALTTACPPAANAGAQATVAGVVHVCDGVAWGPDLTVAQRQAAVSGAWIIDAASRTITADDNGQSLRPTGGVTYTIPSGLSPMPSFTVDCPASGTISIARSGSATINGAAATVTRVRAANPVGFVVLAHSDTDSYGVSGA